MSMSKKSFLCSLIPPKKRQFISLLAVVLGVAVTVHFIDDFLDRRDEGAKPLIRSGPRADQRLGSLIPSIKEVIDEMHRHCHSQNNCQQGNKLSLLWRDQGTQK